MAMRARVKSLRLAHRDGLPWRGSSLEDVLFPTVRREQRGVKGFQSGRQVLR